MGIPENSREVLLLDIAPGLRPGSIIMILFWEFPKLASYKVFTLFEFYIGKTQFHLVPHHKMA